MGRHRHALLVLAIAGIATAHEPAAADELTSQQVTVSGTLPARSPGLAPVDVDRSRPQSTLSAAAIREIATPLSDFGTLANLLPSFVSSAPNGDGFDAAKNMSLRGFPDGQFNVTLDGIPFQDPDSLTHHSTSLFPASSIDHLTVDRSPGSGTDLGYATIGGSLNIATIEVPARAEALLYGAYGSRATSQFGLRLNSDSPGASGQTGWLLNLQHLQTDGELSAAGGRRDDLMLKTDSRLGHARLVLLYSFDDYHFNNPPSVSTAQIAQFGPGFGFTTAPGTPTFYGYASTVRRADFGYARLQASLADGVQIVDTLYTYSYANHGLSLKGDSTASPVGSGFGVPATDIGGRVSDDRYRTWGNIAQLERESATGTLRGGLWLEHSRQKYFRDAIDLSTGAPYNANKSAGSPVLFDFVSELDTVQPFLEYEWRPTARWAIRPGLRWQRARRSFDASVVPNSLPATDGTIERSVSSSLPSLEANYAFEPQTHAYLQWSTGALLPSQSFFYTGDPAAGNQASPEKAQALQAGLKHASESSSLALDAYVIRLRNDISTVTRDGDTEYVNDGSVRYRGIEAEGSTRLGAGFTAAANASVIRAQYLDAGITSPAQKAGDTIPLAPNYLGLVGLLYAQGPWSGSLIKKFVGTEYQGRNGSADGPNFRVGPYAYVDLALGRSLDEWIGPRHGRLSLLVRNLGNRTPVTDSAGPSIAGPNLVNVLAMRSSLLSFACDL